MLSGLQPSSLAKRRISSGWCRAAAVPLAAAPLPAASPAASPALPSSFCLMLVASRGVHCVCAGWMEGRGRLSVEAQSVARSTAPRWAALRPGPALTRCSAALNCVFYGRVHLLVWVEPCSGQVPLQVDGQHRNPQDGLGHVHLHGTGAGKAGQVGAARASTQGGRPRQERGKGPAKGMPDVCRATVSLQPRRVERSATRADLQRACGARLACMARAAPSTAAAQLVLSTSPACRLWAGSPSGAPWCRPPAPARGQPPSGRGQTCGQWSNLRSNARRRQLNAMQAHLPCVLGSGQRLRPTSTATHAASRPCADSRHQQRALPHDSGTRAGPPSCRPACPGCRPAQRPPGVVQQAAIRLAVDHAVPALHARAHRFQLEAGAAHRAKRQGRRAGRVHKRCGGAARLSCRPGGPPRADPCRRCRTPSGLPLPASPTLRCPWLPVKQNNQVATPACAAYGMPTCRCAPPPS